MNLMSQCDALRNKPKLLFVFGGCVCEPRGYLYRSYTLVRSRRHSEAIEWKDGFHGLAGDADGRLHLVLLCIGFPLLPLWTGNL